MRAALLCLLFVVGDLPEAAAAACCVSATSGGVGRLRPWEKGALGLTTAWSQGLGQWDTSSEWRAFDGTYSDQEVRPSVWGIVRVAERAQVFAVVPGVVTARSAADTEGTGGGLGDVQAGLRYDLIAVGEEAHPSLALVPTVTAPTGRSQDEADDPLGADVTGRGGWVLGLAAVTEYVRLPWFVQLSVGGRLPLPFERADSGVGQRFGPGLDVSLRGGPELLGGDLVVDLSARGTVEGPLEIDGRTLDDTERVDLAAGLGLAYLLSGHWTLTTSMETGLFADGLGDNTLGRLVVAAGLRYSLY